MSPIRRRFIFTSGLVQWEQLCRPRHSPIAHNAFRKPRTSDDEIQSVVV